MRLLEVEMSDKLQSFFPVNNGPLGRRGLCGFGFLHLELEGGLLLLDHLAFTEGERILCPWQTTRRYERKSTCHSASLVGLHGTGISIPISQADPQKTSPRRI